MAPHADAAASLIFGASLERCTHRALKGRLTIGLAQQAVPDSEGQTNHYAYDFEPEYTTFRFALDFDGIEGRDRDGFLNDESLVSKRNWDVLSLSNNGLGFTVSCPDTWGDALIVFVSIST